MWVYVCVDLDVLMKGVPRTFEHFEHHVVLHVCNKVHHLLMNCHITRLVSNRKSKLLQYLVLRSVFAFRQDRMRAYVAQLRRSSVAHVRTGKRAFGVGGEAERTRT